MCLHEPSMLNFSTSPLLGHSTDQSFCTVDTHTAREKFALGTAPANTHALGICLTVDFVFLQSFRYFRFN